MADQPDAIKDVIQELLGDQPKQEPPKQETPAPAPKVDGYSELLAAIKNAEGKQKYSSISEALLGAAHAQEHIARIERENAEFRQAGVRSETVEQLLQRLGEGKPAADQAVQPKPEELEATVRSVLERSRAEERVVQNRTSFVEALTKRYGEKLNDVLQQRAQSLGMTPKEIGDIAARSPSAALALFGESSVTPSVPRSTVNPQALVPQVNEVQPPKDLMLGGSTQETVGFWRALRDEVQKEMGVQ